MIITLILERLLVVVEYYSAGQGLIMWTEGVGVIIVRIARIILKVRTYIFFKKYSFNLNERWEKV